MFVLLRTLHGIELATSRRVMRLATCAHRAGRVLLAIGAALAVCGPAAATTFVRMDERDLAERATVALIGTVAAVDTIARTTSPLSFATRVVIAPEEVLLGEMPDGPLVLTEVGGRSGARVERVFGAAEYHSGERVLVFATQRADGTWRTTAMAMGKYELDDELVATRRFDADVAVIDPQSGEMSTGPMVERARLADLVAQMRAAKPIQPGGPAVPWAAGGGAAARSRTLQAASVIVPTPSAVRAMPGSPAPFTYLGSPSRWFEPDSGVSVVIGVDPAGDRDLGVIASTGAAMGALDAWSTVDGSGMRLESGALDTLSPFAGCDGTNRIVFNDPFGEIDDPVDCRGVLGIGGYCFSDEQTTVNGTAFNRIRLGKVTIADGWSGCALWTSCSVAQILTHEVGHAIGLGHSTDPDATMAPSAHFDGRCAALGADDVAGVRFMYPLLPTPTPSRTPTFTPMPSSTATATRTPTRQPTRTGAIPELGPHRVSGRVTYYSNDAAVGGVVMELSGASHQQESSDGAGRYAFGSVPDGTVLVRPTKLGGVGQAVSALDAAYALQASAGLRVLDPIQQLACDVTGNGSVSPLDAARILQRKIGLLDRLPVAESCASDWVFVPAPAPVSNLESVAPLFDLDACTPGSVSYAPLQSDAAEQDFRAAVVGDCTGNWLPTGDARAADPVPAPSGTELVMGPLQHVRGDRWRVAMGIRGPAPMYSLDLELRYDATRLTPVKVRQVRLGDTALIDYQITQPGRLTIALASALPIPADGRGIVVVDLTAVAADISTHLVRPFSIAIDERVVPTPAR